MNHAKEWLRGFMTAHPEIYFTLTRTPDHKRKWVRPDSELLIEGYQRSANTFATNAFLHLNGRDFRLAHHLHAVAHVVRACRMKVPVLLLVREPLGCVSSRLLRHPHFDPAAMLYRYTDFYSRLLSRADDVVVARFDCFIDQFNTYVKALNAKYDSTFVDRPLLEQDQEEIQARIRQINYNMGNVSDIQVSIPTEEKKKSKVQIEQRIHNEAPDQLRKASETYERMAGHDPVNPFKR